MAEQEQTAATTEEQPQPQASLAIQDLLLLSQIVQLAAERGALRANELSSVGDVYNKLINFLDAAGAFKQAEPGEAEQPTEEQS